MNFKTLGAAKVKELKRLRDEKSINNLLDALNSAAIGSCRQKMNSSRSMFVYPDNSRITIRMDGYCYEHTGWVNIKGKAVFVSEDDIEDPAINLGFKIK